eukprot:65924_1
MASFISDSKSDESTKNLRRHSFPESSVEISGVKNLSKDVYSKQESPVQVQNVATSPAVSSETHSDKVAVDECTSETKTSPSDSSSDSSSDSDCSSDSDDSSSSESDDSTKCSECRENVPKYRCPRCDARTCSVKCVTSHKKARGCSGKRQRSEYTRTRHMNDETINEDFVFLEKINETVKNLQRPGFRNILPESIKKRELTEAREQKRTHAAGGRGRKKQKKARGSGRGNNRSNRGR